MKNRDYHVEDFKLRIYDTDSDGNILPEILFKILQEAGVEQHYYVNGSLLETYLHGYSWVLVQAQIELYRVPRYRDNLKIKTWISLIRSIKAIREYEIYDNEGNLIGAANKLWAFFNLESKRPAALPQEVKDKWPVVDKKALKLENLSHIKLENADAESDIAVRRSDLDINEHVNNIQYIKWIREVLPDEFEHKGLKSLKARFVAEAKYRDRLRIRRTAVDDSSFVYEVYNLTREKSCFIARAEFFEE